ncbi:MAG: hypothetical protein KME13_23890 [Myxacorys californica WJT36-NPBG1]|jgi:hypothetical protein|nr:hypothetical protein [Myxacorys californica WJT36-NPBG1]
MLPFLVTAAAALSVAVAPSASAAEPLWINAGESAGVTGTVQISLDSTSVRAASPGVIEAFVKVVQPKTEEIRKVSIACGTGKISWGQGFNDPRSYPIRRVIELSCVPGMSK